MDTITGNSVLDVFFGPDTMSVHFKARTPILTKKGRPGERKSVHQDKIVSPKELQELIDAIFEEMEERSDGFLEIDKSLSKVLQVGPYRIVIVYPPLSDGLEMTVVKPTKKLSLSDYGLDEKVVDLLRNQSKGILIAGSPGSGKTTFAQAIVEMYVGMDKVIKTLESPRDLMVAESVVQYSFSYGSHNELRDVLLLSRPDYTVYDEVRNHEDFLLYKDLRLTGIGLIGVIHATRPVDAIQRFVGTIELGIIPQVIDTVVYVDKGTIASMYQLSLQVKVPAGMKSEDLARPVVQIHNFKTGEVEFEMYTYGEQVVVIPLDAVDTSSSSGALTYAETYLQEYFDRELSFPSLVHLRDEQTMVIYVHISKKGNLIGKGGETIHAIEQDLGLRIQIKTFDDLPCLSLTPEFHREGKKKSALGIQLPSHLSGQDVTIRAGKRLYTSYTDRNARLVIQNKSLIKSIETQGLCVIDTSRLGE